jgi:hypothetical protein
MADQLAELIDPVFWWHFGRHRILKTSAGKLCIFKSRSKGFCRGRLFVANCS